MSKPQSSKLQSKKLTVALFVFYLLVVSFVVLFKTRFAFAFLHVKFNLVSLDISRSVNLIPFGGMLVLNGRPDYNEIILNALAFVPLGVFLCMLRKKRSFANLMAPVLLTSLLYEAAQYAFAIGAADITDVIANTLGGLAGIGAFFALRKICGANVYWIVNAAALALAVGFMLLLSMVRPL